MKPVIIEKITVQRIHSADCRCDCCNPDASIWPSPMTGFACVLIAIAGIAVNFISFT